jgi:hypothetical protein
MDAHHHTARSTLGFRALRIRQTIKNLGILRRGKRSLMLDKAAGAMVIFPPIPAPPKENKAAWDSIPSAFID